MFPPVTSHTRQKDHLKVTAADEKGGVDASRDVLENVVKRVRDHTSKLRGVVVALHGVRLTAPGLGSSLAKWSREST